MCVPYGLPTARQKTDHAKPYPKSVAVPLDIGRRDRRLLAVRGDLILRQAALGQRDRRCLDTGRCLGSARSPRCFGHAPTGAPLAYSGIDILRVQGGKIVERWIEYDARTLQRQVEAAAED